jgi:hypothetical protein
LEQLYWFFTSADWISHYPNSVVLPLANTVPCVVNIDTFIPKANIFRFENFWVEQPSFMDYVKSAWEQQSKKKYSSAIIVDKFKVLRQGLKRWHVSLSKLKIVIQNCNKVIFILDSLEEKKASVHF